MEIYKGKTLPRILWQMMLLILSENIGAKAYDSYEDVNGSFSETTTTPTALISANPTETVNNPDVECQIDSTSTNDLNQLYIFTADGTMNVSCVCSNANKTYPDEELCPTISAREDFESVVQHFDSESYVANGSCRVSRIYYIQTHSYHSTVEFECSDLGTKTSMTIDIYWTLFGSPAPDNVLTGGDETKNQNQADDLNPMKRWLSAGGGFVFTFGIIVALMKRARMNRVSRTRNTNPDTRPANPDTRPANPDTRPVTTTPVDTSQMNPRSRNESVVVTVSQTMPEQPPSYTEVMAVPRNQVPGYLPPSSGSVAFFLEKKEIKKKHSPCHKKQ